MTGVQTCALPILCQAVQTPGPVALVNRRKMAAGLAGAEGSNHAHDALKKDVAVAHLRSRGRVAAAEYLEQATAVSTKQELKGSRGSTASRTLFGKILCEMLEPMSAEERRAAIRVFDNDLEGSCGLGEIRKAYPDIFVRAGIMERGNFSAAARRAPGMSPPASAPTSPSSTSAAPATTRTPRP